MRVIRVVALGAIAALAITGCSPSGQNGSDGTSGTEGAVFDPADLVLQTDPGQSEVDHVDWGVMGGEPTTIDPVRVQNNNERIVTANMCEWLMTLTPEFGSAPNLATSADWTDDLTFVIELRDDVTFWDGAPMTAEDVVFSLNRARNPESQSVNVSAFASVDQITATGDHEVTVTFTQPDGDFRNAITGPAGVVFEKAFTESVGEDAIGTADGGVMCTGPFKLGDWVPGGTMTIEANQDYWGGAPLTQEIEYQFVADDSTLTSALLAGEIDGAYLPGVSAMSQLEASEVGSVFIGPSTASLGFGPATDQGPAANPRVREALDLAIDKDAVISTVLGGYGAPVKTFTSPFAWSGLAEADIYREGYDALPDNSRDIERAKEIIADQEISDEPLVMAIVAGEQAQLQAATIIQSAAKEIGLTIEIKQMQGPEFGQIFADASAREGLDFVLTTAGVITPGVLLYAEFFARSDGLFNWSRWDNAEATESLDQARREIDPLAAAQAFVSAQAIYGPDRLKIELAQEYMRTFMNDDLTGVTTSWAALSSPWALELGGK